jgi:hypothetical protein
MHVMPGMQQLTKPRRQRTIQKTETEDDRELSEKSEVESEKSDVVLSTQSIQRQEQQEISASSISQQNQAQKYQSQSQIQSSILRRKLRQEFRILIEELTNRRQELIQPQSDELDRALERGNNLFENVKFPREAALDSEFLSLISQLGVEQCHRLQTGFRTYTIDDYITKIKTFLQRDENVVSDTMSRAEERQHEQEQEDVRVADRRFNWPSLTNSVLKYFKITPSAHFLNGALSVQFEGRKERRQRRPRDALAEKVVPETVTDTDKDRESEATKRVKQIEQVLEECGKMNFWQFILDPESFSRSVENIFHFSFLIKDGRASLQTENDCPVTQTEDPPEESDYATGKAMKKQTILKFDMQLWETVKNVYRIDKAMIPPPPPNPYNRSYEEVFTQTSKGHLAKRISGDASAEDEDEASSRRHSPKIKSGQRTKSQKSKAITLQRSTVISTSSRTTRAREQTVSNKESEIRPSSPQNSTLQPQSSVLATKHSVQSSGNNQSAIKAQSDQQNGVGSNTSQKRKSHVTSDTEHGASDQEKTSRSLKRRRRS